MWYNRSTRSHISVVDIHIALGLYRYIVRVQVLFTLHRVIVTFGSIYVEPI